MPTVKIIYILFCHFGKEEISIFKNEKYHNENQRCIIIYILEKQK